ncbi:MAG: DNA mismatch endonuclease Vsr [Acidobacteria bacterium]|nr:DNA mismatch endonuclease Vsr [Acidobacteriota bacterium]
MPTWVSGSRSEVTTFGGLSRSELMARVRGRGNKSTELKLVALLKNHRVTGWRRHLSFLPGKPDFTWRRQKVVVFVDGCFWHGHTCPRGKLPGTNVDAWRIKIDRNRRRDRRNARALRSRGWRVLRVWECQLRKDPERVLRRVRRAVESRKPRATPA